MKCLLCESAQTHFFSIQQKPVRDYWFCQNCEFVFMQPEQHLKSVEEKLRYEQHENQDSESYHNYLLPIIELVKKYIPQKNRGLDFGCGPNPFLAKLLGQMGFEIENFDPYFFPQSNLIEQKYSFITCTEVVEHFLNPELSWQKMISLLKTDGFLFIMTQPHQLNYVSDSVGGIKEFTNWAYRRDVTHVGFYNAKTFTYLSRKYNFNILEIYNRGFVAQVK